MKKDKAIRKLQKSLTELIEAWIDETAESEAKAWEPIGYISDNIGELMARAAMTALEASADVQDYLRQDEIIA